MLSTYMWIGSMYVMGRIAYSFGCRNNRNDHMFWLSSAKRRSNSANPTRMIHFCLFVSLRPNDFPTDNRQSLNFLLWQPCRETFICIDREEKELDKWPLELFHLTKKLLNHQMKSSPCLVCFFVCWSGIFIYTQDPHANV